MIEDITSQGPRRPILRTLLVVLISLALALLLAEGMVRLADALGLVDLSPSLAEVAVPGQLEDQVDLGAASGTGGPLYVGDPVLHHRMAANWSGFFPEEIVQEVGRTEVPIRTNSLGLRSPEIALAKPPDTFRILVLGDSVTFGWSLRGEDTYASQLASLLATLRPNQRVEVINAGVSGYGTWQELRWLQETGLALDPDVIIVQTHLNDAADNLWGTLGWQQGSDSWLVRTSMLARLISRVSSARQVGSGDAPCATDWKVDADQVCWQRTEELLSEIQREASGARRGAGADAIADALAGGCRSARPARVGGCDSVPGRAGGLWPATRLDRGRSAAGHSRSHELQRQIALLGCRPPGRSRSAHPGARTL